MGTPNINYGHWVWDDNLGELSFVSHEVKPKARDSLKSSLEMIREFAGYKHADLNITFRDNVNMLEKIRFRRHYQRRIKPNERDIITLRDVKDVVIFQAVSPLPLEFIDFFHTFEVDRLLRSLIVYFQLYIQTFDLLMERRDDVARKLHHPNVIEVEHKLRANLSLLRSVVAREYCCLLLGTGNIRPFHHMANKQHMSNSERDVQLFELLFQMSVRVVWIALRRRYGNLIEDELNRLFRGNIFNLVRHQKHHRRTSALSTPHELTVLHNISEEEPKVLTHSPAFLELSQDYDYQLMGIGYIEFEIKSPRIKFFETVYNCPEEELSKHGMTIGILGLPRDNFDAMLVENPKPKSSSTQLLHSESPKLKAPLMFAIPNPDDEELVPSSFPHSNIYSHDIHLEQRNQARKMWRATKTHPPV